MKFLIAFLSALLLSTSALADNAMIQAILLGENQVPPVTTPIIGEFLFTTTDNNWYLAAKGTNSGDLITAAHIHCGKAGTNGPVVYPFISGTPRISIYAKGKFDNSKFVPYQTSVTCPVIIKNITQLRTAIKNGYAYVNVHTQAHPAGTVRGQVFTLIP